MAFYSTEASRLSAKEAELTTAANIQISMLPEPEYVSADGRIKISARMVPSRDVGGDFYDYFEVDDTHFCFLIADVSDKGVPAALFMSRAKAFIKSYAMKGYTPDKVMTEANKALIDGNRMHIFVTVWMGIIDTRTGVVKFANAGHEKPLVSYNGDSFEYISSKANLVMGTMPKIVYRLNELTLKPGSKILLYTDGITDNSNIEDEQYGSDRLKAFADAQAKASGVEILERLYKEMDSHMREAEQFDDMTALILSYDA